jgi:allantoicase
MSSAAIDTHHRRAEEQAVIQAPTGQHHMKTAMAAAVEWGRYIQCEKQLASGEHQHSDEMNRLVTSSAHVSLIFMCIP